MHSNEMSEISPNAVTVTTSKVKKTLSIPCCPITSRPEGLNARAGGARYVGEQIRSLCGRGGHSIGRDIREALNINRTTVYRSGERVHGDNVALWYGGDVV